MWVKIKEILVNLDNVEEISKEWERGNKEVVSLKIDYTSESSNTFDGSKADIESEYDRLIKLLVK